MKSGSNRGLPYGWLSTPLAGDKFVSLTHRRPLPSGKYSWYSFLLFLDHTFRFSTGGNFTIIAGQSSGTRKAYAYSHNPVDWPVGCRVAARAIQYYAGSPAGSWVSSGAGVAHRHLHTLRFWPDCIRAITFHCSVSRVLKQQTITVVRMGDFDFDIELLISLVDARPVLWDKTWYL